MEVNRSIIPFKIDTGANVNIISHKDYEQLCDKPRLKVCKTTVYAYGGDELPVKGQFVADIVHKKNSHKALIVVSSSEVQPILSLDTSETLGLVKRVYQVQRDQISGGKEQSGGIPKITTKESSGGVPKIEGFLTKEKIKKHFPDAFKGLGCLPGEYDMELKEGSVPVVEAGRNQPFGILDDLKQELDRMEEKKVIMKLGKGEPTEWLNSMVPVYKANKKIRVCMDPRNLNKCIKREHYKLPTRDEIAAKSRNPKWFSKLDASKGFWQVKLTEKASKLCTFNSPFGRYRYLRLPFGVNCATEIFSRIIAEMFEHIDGVVTSVDDIKVEGDTREEHDKRLAQVLKVCIENNLTLNWDKCEIGVNSVLFIGDLYTDHGVKPDPKKIQGILSLEKPTDSKGVQRVVATINYHGKFVPNLSAKTEPLRRLMDQDKAWYWGPEQDKAWQVLKDTLSSEPILKYYDPNRETLISSDASQKGLGACLLQKHGDSWHPVAYASRAMTVAETRYAQIEKETLAICFACERFHQYVFGMEFQVETDHKPLVSIFTKALCDVPLRLQRMRLRLQWYTFSLTYTPGKFMITADALSRNYSSDTGDPDLEKEIMAYVDGITTNMRVTENRINVIREETQNDTSMKKLAETILVGWPEERRKCPGELADYWNYRDEMSVVDGLIFKGNRIIIPSSLRTEMLKKIHTGHQGEVKCKRRVRNTMFWPRINQDIENVVKDCTACLLYQRKQQKEPLSPHPIATRPWSYVGTDLFEHKKKHYVVVYDEYSNYPEVEKISSQTGPAVVKALKAIFGRQGVPDHVSSDNGPCYDSEEFKKFSIDWNFIHDTSSPRYPKSNGLAEKAVQIVKDIFNKCDESGEDRDMGLLVYRDTPLECGLSPAELMGRKIRSNLPIAVMEQMANSEKVVESKIKQKQRQKHYHDKGATR